LQANLWCTDNETCKIQWFQLSEIWSLPCFHKKPTSSLTLSRWSASTENITWNRLLWSLYLLLSVNSDQTSWSVWWRPLLNVAGSLHLWRAECSRAWGPCVWSYTSHARSVNLQVSAPNNLTNAVQSLHLVLRLIVKAKRICTLHTVNYSNRTIIRN